MLTKKKFIQEKFPKQKKSANIIFLFNNFFNNPAKGK
jgi:hypothetical protein